MNGNMCWRMALIGLCVASVSHAAIITVGDHEVLADRVTPIQILIEREAGDPEMVGMDLAMMISGDDGPTLGAIDLVTATPFEGHHVGGSTDQGSDARHAFWGVITASGSVPIPDTAVLATVEIDATGIYSGTFDLHLTSVLGVDTLIYDADLNPVVLNQGQPITGSVSVVIPEPATFMWLVPATMMAAARRGRGGSNHGEAVDHRGNGAGLSSV